MKVYTTPVGTARYPRLNTPDTSFGEVGNWQTQLILSEEDYQMFHQQIQEAFDLEYDLECRRAGKKLPLKKKNGLFIDNDGDHVLFAKQKAQTPGKEGIINWTVAVFDSTGKKINDLPPIGTGSKMKLNVEPYFWYAPGDLDKGKGFGYTFRLKAAQLLELVEYQPKGERNVFDAVEGGYVAEDLEDSFTDNDAKVPF